MAQTGFITDLCSVVACEKYQRTPKSLARSGAGRILHRVGDDPIGIMHCCIKYEALIADFYTH